MAKLPSILQVKWKRRTVGALHQIVTCEKPPREVEVGVLTSSGLADHLVKAHNKLTGHGKRPSASLDGFRFGDSGAAIDGGPLW